jgi:pimeloyl-ACP methyl ester carboxylesterase
MPSVLTRTGNVAYEVSGSGAPLVLLHGNGHDRRDFDAIVPALCAAGFRTFAVDWPGFGESDAPPVPSAASTSLMADVLEDLVDALRLEPAIFVGNSLGGTASVRLAARRPDRVRALVLVDTGGFVKITPLVRAFCWLQGREWVRRATGKAFGAWYMKARNDAVRGVLGRIEGARDRRATIAVEAALWRRFADDASSVAREAARVRCPALIVWGRHDPVLRARIEGARARRSLRSARYVELDTGHVPFVEAPQDFLGAVLPFLDGVAAVSGPAPRVEA